MAPDAKVPSMRDVYQLPGSDGGSGGETAAGDGLSVGAGAGTESPKMGSGGSNASGVASAIGLSGGSDGREDGRAEGTAGGGGTSGFGPSPVRSPDESSLTVEAPTSARRESSIARQNDRSVPPR